MCLSCQSQVGIWSLANIRCPSHFIYLVIQYYFHGGCFMMGISMWHKYLHTWCPLPCAIHPCASSATTQIRWPASLSAAPPTGKYFLSTFIYSHSEHDCNAYGTYFQLAPTYWANSIINEAWRLFFLLQLNIQEHPCKKGVSCERFICATLVVTWGSRLPTHAQVWLWAHQAHGELDFSQGPSPIYCLFSLSPHSNKGAITTICVSEYHCQPDLMPNSPQSI